MISLHEEVLSSADSVTYRARIDEGGFGANGSTPSGSSMNGPLGIGGRNSSWFLLRLHRTQYPSEAELAAVRQEYALATGLAQTSELLDATGFAQAGTSSEVGVIRYLDLVPWENDLGIAMEDFGVNLSDHRAGLATRGPLPPETFLAVAIALASALRKVHDHKLILRNLTTKSFYVAETGDGGSSINGPVQHDICEAKIADLSSATELSATGSSILAAHTSSSAAMLTPFRLQFISPEQTGRMNRPTDHRSDLYSLGVIFYRMLAGVYPFEANHGSEHASGRADQHLETASPLIAAELVHAHVARQPSRVPLENAHVPEILCDLTLKLLAKSADDRYQSAYGLEHDLRRAFEFLKELNAQGRSLVSQENADRALRTFALAENDRSDIFRISSRLYGREREIARLRQAFDRSRSGVLRQFVLVAGAPGIGKSAVIHELDPIVTASNGYFVEGKYDQYERNIPFRGILQGLGALLKLILREDAGRIQRLRARLTEALGANARILADLLPELEALIGKQPAVAVLGSAESQNRFNFVLLRFLQRLATEESPIVLFLDDLQWADAGSLALLRLILTSEEIAHLTIVGAYRDSEVDDTHPLHRLLADLEHQRIRIEKLLLEPLHTRDVQTLLADSLQSGGAESEQTDELWKIAEIAHQKTDGNPFYLLQFLHSLPAEGGLYFDRTVRRWKCNLAKLQKSASTENVVDFLVRKLARLESGTGRAVRIAACIGSDFSLDVLARASGESTSQTLERLRPALAAGLIVPNGADVSQPMTDHALPMTDHALPMTDHVPLEQFRFLHDRVQQAAYGMTSDMEHRALHATIGRLLLAGYDTEGRSDDDARIFEIVNQCNRGSDEFRSEEEQARLLHLNLRAGRKAQKGTAFEAARQYLTHARLLLRPDSWEKDYQTTLEIYNREAECACLTVEYDRVRELASVVLANAVSPLDKVEIYRTSIQATVYTDMIGSVRLMIQALEVYGLKLPKHPNKLHIILKILRTKMVTVRKTSLRRQPVLGLANTPAIEDKWKFAITSLIDVGGTAAYDVAPDVYPLLLLELVLIFLKYGASQYTSSAVAGYAPILSVPLGDILGGQSFGELALRLADRFSEGGHTARTRMIYLVETHHWTYPLHETLDKIKECIELAFQEGDNEYGTHSAFFYPTVTFFSGSPISDVNAALEYSERAIRKTQHQNTLSSLQALRLCLEHFTEDYSPDRGLHGNFVNEAFARDLEESHHLYNLFNLHLHKAFVAFYFNDYHTCNLALRRIEPFIEARAGEPVVPLFFFLDGMCALLAAEGGEPMSREAKKRIARSLKKFAKWSKHSSANFSHRYDLLRAEWALGKRKVLEAERAYDLAIAAAREHGYLSECAFASERAARHYQREGRASIAALYFREAKYYYRKWGATAKVEALDLDFPGLRQHDTIDELQTASGSSRQNAGARLGDVLDLSAVMRASGTLAGEIVLEDLLAKLMRFAIENAGADRGVLLLENGGRLFVEAEADDTGVTRKLLASEPLENQTELPQTVINYVFRLREVAIQNDPMKEGPFTQDPYVRRNSPRSIFAMPLMHQAKLAGVLYLENKLAADVFTADRVELLNVISGQAVISIENAKLYRDLAATNETLKRTNVAYSRFVPRAFLGMLDKGDITQIQLGDQVQKEMTVMFCDIRDFTKLSEKMSPKENFDFLNSVLRLIGPVIREHRGFIDKYIGDAVMALFPQSAEDALRAGVSLCRILNRMNRTRSEQGLDPIRVGIGIHTGVLMLGTIGEHERMEGTVISDAVNLASRIESLTKHFDATLFISEAAFYRIPDHDTVAHRRIGRIRLKGKSEAVSVIQILDGEDERYRERLAESASTFEAGLECYRNKDFGAAAHAFEAVLHMNANDSACFRYLEDARRHMQHGVPSNWEAVVVMDSK